MFRKNKELLTKLNALILLLSVFICFTYIAIYFVKQDYLMVLMGVVVVILDMCIYKINYIKKYRIPVFSKTVIFLFVLMSAVFGSVVNFFGNVFLYDKATHFASGLVASYLFIDVIEYYDIKGIIGLKIRLFLLLCFNATIAVFWEIIEYFSDYFFKSDFQKGLTDTMWDMIVAIIGGIIISLMYIKKYKAVYRRFSKIN